MCNCGLAPLMALAARGLCAGHGVLGLVGATVGGQKSSPSSKQSHDTREPLRRQQAVPALS